MKTKPSSSKIIAHKMMEAIQYDNGAVNINNPESYPQEWINKIRIKVLNFILQNPEFDFTDEVIDDICAGEHLEKITKYGHFAGYDALDKVLNEYFNNM